MADFGGSAVPEGLFSVDECLAMPINAAVFHAYRVIEILRHEVTRLRRETWVSEAVLRQKIAADIVNARESDYNERTSDHETADDTEPCDHSSWACHASSAYAAYSLAARVALGETE